MKIGSINSTDYSSRVRRVKNEEKQTIQGQYKVISMSEYLSSPISFRGRNKEQAIFYGAEVAPYSKAGGVGVVMKDYTSILPAKDEIVVSPYYGATVDKETGTVSPLKDEDGDYILKTNSGTHKLNLIAEKEMQWGKRTDNKIMLFNLKDEKEKIHYFVFDDATGHYKKPYEGGAVYATGSRSKTQDWNGDAYAKNSKAFVELLPELIASKEDFNPATIVCSDSQTAYTHEYIVQKAVKKEQGYDEIKTTHVGHNLGPGYCGETSMQNMFVNLGATPQQIKMIERDPLYKQKGDAYFKEFVKEALDETGSPSATQIALHHASKKRANNEGFVKSISVVAEDYADSLATNPQAAHNIHQTVKELYADGTFNGILNPLEDTSVSATKKLPNPKYNEECIDKDGTVYPAFEIYPENVSFEEMRRIKNANKLKLLQRLSAIDSTITTGDKARTAKVNPEAQGVYDGPVIKPELLEKIKNGEGDEVPLFVSWGRVDTQKGFDIALNAFEEFAKTEEGKNAIFIMGAGFDKGDESKKIGNKVKEMLKDPDLQGRIVHIDGWAPAYAMSSAADAAVFTSRFEPCGLTDLEAMKYYCMPIVTNTQGFKQKNFDPRSESVEEKQKATSFKTQHEYNLTKEQVELIINAYVNEDAEALEKVKEEFPIFKTNKNGVESYDSSVFEQFATEYKDFIEKRKQELKYDFEKEEDFPEKWNDWDELSKEHSFKFGGFARELKDAILAKETAEAIKACVNTPKETKELMFNNLKDLDTSWKGNAKLHPTGESSATLYINRHLMPDYSKPTKSDVIAKDDAFIEDTIVKNQKNDINNRANLYREGALVGIIGLLATRIKKAKISDKELEQIEKNIADKLTQQFNSEKADLQKKLNDTIKKNSKNMAITGVVAAIGGAIAAVAVTTYFMKKKASKNPVVSTPSVAKEVKKEEIKTPQVKETQKQQTTNTNLLLNNTSKTFAGFQSLV